MTQLELARILGVGQAAVSKVERQHDLLLSTLANYVQAAGAQARIMVTVGDQEIEYDLADFAQPADTAEITQTLPGRHRDEPQSNHGRNAAPCRTSRPTDLPNQREPHRG
ncbi:helix-turn-helix transcriptional regulator [Mycobacteroides abscessus]|uniref:helix-turn-helix domain-containing protein n=1 Tax=Mycobacteroides abscessus TaxID=36809 RepID=UPI002E8DDBBA|nr:helix-turn-helix transcriptional regulator [Mycobacteroides abscessus]